jgi:hypothetical protein
MSPVSVPQKKAIFFLLPLIYFRSKCLDRSFVLMPQVCHGENSPL